MYVRTQYTRSECVYISCEHRASLPYQRALIRPATIAVLSVVNVHSCVCVRVCTCVHVHNTAPTPGFTSGYRGDSWTDPERFNQVSHIITHAYKFFLVRRSTAYIRYTWQPLNTGVQYKGSDPLSRSMITLLRMTA